MTIVKIKDKRIGVTYVYDQEKTIWDSEKKQARSKRKLIGKIDEKTGEIVPTRNWGKNRKVPSNYKDLYESMKKENELLKKEIAELRLENALLKNTKQTGTANDDK